MNVNILVITAFLTASASLVFAQQGPPPPPPGGHYDDDLAADNPTTSGRSGPLAALSEEKRDEIRKKIEAVRIWKLTEELKLDTDTSAKLSSLLSSFELKQRELMKTQRETMRELRSLLKTANPVEAKIKPLLAKIEKHHRTMQELRDKQLSNLKNILTTEQQARFLLFQQEFQRDIREIISGARGPGKGGMRPGGGPLRGGQEDPQQIN